MILLKTMQLTLHRFRSYVSLLLSSIVRERKRAREGERGEKKRSTDRIRICRQTINDCSIEPIAIPLKKQE